MQLAPQHCDVCCLRFKVVVAGITIVFPLRARNKLHVLLVEQSFFFDQKKSSLLSPTSVFNQQETSLRDELEKGVLVRETTTLNLSRNLVLLLVVPFI